MIFGQPLRYWLLAWVATLIATFVFVKVPFLASIFGLVNFLIFVPLFLYFLWKVLKVAIPFGIAAYFDGGYRHRWHD